MKYKTIICGGTFDRLHPGHKAFLREAFNNGEHVVIGITSDKYVLRNKKDPTILSFSQRKKGVESFLQNEGFLSRAKIAKIDSRFDQTQVGDDSNAALLVSEETYNVGQEINTEREKNGLQAFPLIVFRLVKDSKGYKISSSTIRKKMDVADFSTPGVKGPNTPGVRFSKEVLHLPDSLRQELQQPFGPLIQDFPKETLSNPEKIITVGDVTTKKMLEEGVTPRLSVVDFVVERHRQYHSFQELGFGDSEKVYTLTNPAGTIAKETWSLLEEIVNNLNTPTNNILFVDGEEDLLVIPIILVFPIGFSLFYGQPRLNNAVTKEGIVYLTITKKLKKRAQNLINSFILYP